MELVALEMAREKSAVDIDGDGPALGKILAAEDADGILAQPFGVSLVDLLLSAGQGARPLLALPCHRIHDLLVE